MIMGKSLVNNSISPCNVNQLSIGVNCTKQNY